MLHLVKHSVLSWLPYQYYPTNQKQIETHNDWYLSFIIFFHFPSFCYYNPWIHWPCCYSTRVCETRIIILHFCPQIYSYHPRLNLIFLRVNSLSSKGPSNSRLRQTILSWTCRHHILFKLFVYRGFNIGNNKLLFDLKWIIL